MAFEMINNAVGTPDRLRRRQREDVAVNLEQLIALESACVDGVQGLDFDGLGGTYTNPIWREKVVQWCYDVVDHLNERRSIVYTAMNILDRYVIKQNYRNLSDRLFELASLSALFLAVRISGSKTLRLSQLLGMSRSGLAVKDIIKMGTSMIKTLTWDHRVVTPMEFVRAYCDKLPSCVSDEEKQNLLNYSSFLVEIAVCDVGMSNKKASQIALAATLNALNSSRSLDLPSFNKAVEAITEVVQESAEVAKTRIQLQQLYNQSSESKSMSSPHLIVDDDDLPSIVSSDSLRSLETSTMENSLGTKRKKMYDMSAYHAEKRTKTSY